MDADFEEQIRKDFIAEASEMLEAIESAFIEFERDPDDDQVIDKIFRLAHTIKGSALSCGFMALGDFAHIVETLLVRIRDKKISVSSTIVDLLLESNDRLGALVAALSDSDRQVETEDLTGRIRDILEENDDSISTVAAKAMAAEGYGIFDDDPVLPQKPAPVSNLAAVSDLLSRQFDIYLGLIRLSLGEQKTLPAALDEVINQNEMALQAIAKLKKALG